MTEYSPRLFSTDAEIARLGEGLISCTLSREDWTHEAHLGATAYLLLRRADIDLDKQLPSIIRRFNESVGGVNSDTEGYHETITQAYIRAVRAFLARTDATLPLAEKVNALLKAPEGRRDWPLRFYSRERLFSKQARLGWVEPDVKSLPPAV
jgi:hypothetical protein